MCGAARYRLCIILCNTHRLIASRLDFDMHTKDCRIAFHGKVMYPLEPAVPVAS